MRSYETPAHMFHWIKSGFEYWSQQEGDEVLPGPGLGDGFWCCATGRAVKSVVQRGRGAGHGQRLLTDGLLHLSPGVKPRCYNTGAILSRIQSTLCIDIGKEPRHTFFRNTKLMDSRKCISWRVTTLAVSTLKEIDFLNDCWLSTLSKILSIEEIICVRVCGGGGGSDQTVLCIRIENAFTQS